MVKLKITIVVDKILYFWIFVLLKIIVGFQPFLSDPEDITAWKVHVLSWQTRNLCVTPPLLVTVLKSSIVFPKFPST
jgi:hypothetical protein